ncbi:tRNA (guanine(37)-N1)-methyltransferase-like [Actinia tenebrosa]|uniref:tRNA (guanine(37)-N1)-methyltransferase n=1 Tax=Actinia tenebrosa TaxID=6105 RepID=A0A6P8IQM8_ACTTE|nr:tRNA (guanine(37)-N1)-methyltransferase-like [Actinia tenebrosa]
MSGIEEYNNENLIVTPPVTSRGCRTLNREDFTKVFRLPALRIDAKKCSLFMKSFRKLLLNRPRLRNIVPDPSNENNSKKLVLLRPGVLLNEEEKEFICTHNADETVHDLVLDYNFWTSEQVLRAILPPEISEVPSAFETIGHIAHVNLRENQLEYKSVIGQVLLDKNSPQIKTVVNKTNTIDETFRFFKMELLAGEDNMNATVKEDGCIFEFDFSQVYWNSRLQTEHKRLVEIFSKTDIICDMFAGVGPFAIPAAKKGCYVHANDLNPSSYEALVKNAKLNKVEKNIIAYNMDGKEFVRKMVESLADKSGSGNQMFNHVIMNLPASAVQFLDVFKGLFINFKDRFRVDDSSKSRVILPMVHCYCFSKSEAPEQDAQSQAEVILGVKMGSDCKVHYVRDVAPKKAMLCVSFRLPASVAFCEHDQKQRDDSEPPSKQAKIEEDSKN